LFADCAIHRKMGRQMRAIDLYSGVGGWSLGLKLAGIEVVASFEWWDRANDTHEKNLGLPVHQVNIRELDFKLLPNKIDLVVGSPPCTQFSFSNRGGSGDIADGMKDVIKFLEVVQYLKPKYWAMENVPRLKSLLEEGRKANSPLEPFRKLIDKMQIHIVNMAEFGVPQDRQRCIAGVFPFDLLFNYKKKCSKLTLGEVIAAFQGDTVKDPNYGFSITRSKVTELQEEPPLNDEELRLNREAKIHHPIYNNMAFPDRLERPVRTVTAVCTRVSRESIVIADPVRAGKFRRLTVRERASLQGFPITYQFFGRSYSEKLRMIGNAIPPVFTYYIGQAARDIPAESLQIIRRSSVKIPSSKLSPINTPPDQQGRTYPANRSFRLAIPGLRFKSGMRFELANKFLDDEVQWRVNFYYGNSKDIKAIKLEEKLLDKMRVVAVREKQLVPEILATLSKNEMTINEAEVQETWAHISSETHPFQIVDKLGEVAADIVELVMGADAGTQSIIRQFVAEETFPKGLATADLRKPSAKKIDRYFAAIYAGWWVGSWFNKNLKINSDLKVEIRRVA
jgi:DNA (cytosine-5)-methyltransferase 1